MKFNYRTETTPEWDFTLTGNRFTHVLEATNDDGVHLGEMVWVPFHVRDIQVVKRYRRRGVATALWNEGHRLADENPDIPAPRHSVARTASGDAWVKAVGP